VASLRACVISDWQMGRGHVLHGLVAAHLEGDWYWLDVRGNTPGVDAQFSLGDERLARTANPDAEEIDYMVVAIAPAEVVVDVLTSARDIGVPGPNPTTPRARLRLVVV
jgi:hypothetical protein